MVQAVTPAESGADGKSADNRDDEDRKRSHSPVIAGTGKRKMNLPVWRKRQARRAYIPGMVPGRM